MKIINLTYAGKFTCLLLLIVLSCQSFSHGESSKLQVFVSIPPQAYLVERIGGSLVAVDVMVQPGQEPHTFEPTPKQMIALGSARLYIQVGTLPFEMQLLQKIQQTLPNLQVVNSAQGLSLCTLDHAHDHGHETHDEGGDPHIWLGPKEIAHQAKQIADTIKDLLPQHKESIHANLTQLLKELEVLDHHIKKELSPFHGQAVFVFHPSFAYFLNAYGLHQEAVEVDGKSPSPKQLQLIIQRARKEQIKVIFAQPAFDRKSAALIARGIGGEVVLVDPLEYDLLQNLENIFQKLHDALSKRAQ